MIRLLNGKWGADFRDGVMEMKNAQDAGAVEAILFAMGDAVEIDVICRALDLTKKEAQALLQEMMETYDARERGIRLIRLEDSYQLCTKKEYYDALIRAAAVPKKVVLTDVMMETLSIIAYRQPVTKLEIEKIRGVKSDHAVNRLIEYGLAEETGRLQAPGRPILLGTTEKFLRHFGLESIEDLPAFDLHQKKSSARDAEEETDVPV